MQMKKRKSSDVFEALARVTPGGVNSPFRSFHEVGAPTMIASRGKGSRVWNCDGESFVDYLGAWGPAVLGHGHADVYRAAREALRRGPVLGLSTELELEMARRVRKAFPSMEMVRFVNSGAEAVECAIRLARGATRRSKIVRFEGGYHGHGDSVLWTYGPEEKRRPEECGVPDGLARETLYAPFNDAGALRALFEERGEEIAALLVEPVAGSMSVIEPRAGFLDACREVTARHAAALIFDEVLTGFRIAYGGAQERYGVRADITCLGKAVGGGFPAGAYGGRRDYMERLAPLGPVYQAGTFSGNPVTMSAGIAALKALEKPGVYAKLEEKAGYLLNGVKEIAAARGIPLQTPRAGSMFAIAFSGTPVENYRDSLGINVKRYAAFFRGMLARGFLFPPSATDAAVLSLAHAKKEIEETLTACSSVLGKLKEEI